jgi:hypothetical protein
MRYVDGERDPENVAWATAASSSIVADAIGKTYPLRAWYWRKSALEYSKPSDDLSRIARAFRERDAVKALPAMRAWLDENDAWDAAELASDWRAAVYRADQTEQDLNDTITNLIDAAFPDFLMNWAYESLREQLKTQRADANEKKATFLAYVERFKRERVSRTSGNRTGASRTGASGTGASGTGKRGTVSDRVTLGGTANLGVSLGTLAAMGAMGPFVGGGIAAGAAAGMASDATKKIKQKVDTAVIVGGIAALALLVYTVRR